MLKMNFLKNKMNLMNSVLRMTAVAFAVALLPVTSHSSIDTIAVDVGISVFKTMPIGVVPFAESKSIDWIEEKPHQIVTRDANGSRMERLEEGVRVEKLSEIFKLSPDLIQKALAILAK